MTYYQWRRMTFLGAVLFGSQLGGELSAAVAHRPFHDPAPTQRDVFGSAVAGQGNRLFVGSPGDDADFAESGQAHLFDATTGDLLRSFKPSMPGEHSNFGESVAMDSNVVAVSARSVTLNHFFQERVELYNAATGVYLRTLDDPQPSFLNHFGYSMAVHGSRVLVGAPGTDVVEQGVGQAYLFDADTGALLRTFAAPFASQGAGFGSSVAFQGDRVLIAAHRDSSQAYLGGQAYLFDADSGELRTTFADPSPGPRENFARSVALDKGFVLVSDQNEQLSDPHLGKVRLFTADGALLRTFENPTPERYDNFGWTVALDGPHALIGSRLDDSGNLIGQSHLFNIHTGSLLTTYSDPDPTHQDFFGEALAFFDGNVVIGAPGDDTRGQNVGQVYLFPVVPEPAAAVLALGGLAVFTLCLRE
jgi:outer membrane protein assembly factor BamB